MKNTTLGWGGFLSICLVLAVLARAQQPQYVGINSSAFNYFPALQKQSEWTWVAGVQMILNYYGIEVNQREILSRLLSDQANPIDSITQALQGEGFGRGRIRTISGLPTSGMLAPATMLNELSQQRPVLVLRGPLNEASVVTAASYLESPNGPVIVSLVMRDPDPDRSATEGKLELSGPQLGDWISEVRCSWVIAVR